MVNNKLCLSVPHTGTVTHSVLFRFVFAICFKEHWPWMNSVLWYHLLLMNLCYQMKQKVRAPVFCFLKAKHKSMDRSHTVLTNSLQASTAKGDKTLASFPQWPYQGDKCYNFISCASYSDNPSHRIIASIKNVYSSPKPFFLSCFAMKQLRVLLAHWERIIILVNILRGPD